MGVETASIGDHLWKRDPRDRKPYRVQVVMKPEGGIVAIRYSSGRIGSVAMNDLYRTREVAEAVAPVPGPRPSRPSFRPARGKPQPRWRCGCAAVNLPGRSCWRCGQPAPAPSAAPAPPERAGKYARLSAARPPRAPPAAPPKRRPLSALRTLRRHI